MRKQPTHVYLATDGTLFKIGVSANVENRMKSLSSPAARRRGQRGRLRTIQLIESWHLPRSARKVELWVKHRLTDNRYSGYEWFERVTKSYMFKLIEAAIWYETGVRVPEHEPRI